MANLCTFDFMDVGQGDSTFIQVFETSTTVPDYAIMVDFGSVKSGRIAGVDATTYVTNQLTKQATPTLDLLLLTHSDRDHYNLLPGLVTAMPNIRVRECVFGGRRRDYTMTLSNWNNINVLTDTIEPRMPGAARPDSLPDNCSTIQAANGSPPWRTYGNLKIWVLQANYPNRKYYGPNIKSIVLICDYFDDKVVLPGDATVETMQQVVSWIKTKKAEAFVKDAVALRIPHHGSERTTLDTTGADAWATTKEFVKMFSADMIAVGADAHGLFRHPRETVIQHHRKYVGSKIYKPAQGTRHRFISYGLNYQNVNGWLHEDTEDNIFTSLVELNQGVQWQLRLTDNKPATVWSTL